VGCLEVEELQLIDCWKLVPDASHQATLLALVLQMHNIVATKQPQEIAIGIGFLIEIENQLRERRPKTFVRGLFG